MYKVQIYLMWFLLFMYVFVILVLTFEEIMARKKSRDETYRTRTGYYVGRQITIIAAILWAIWFVVFPIPKRVHLDYELKSGKVQSIEETEFQENYWEYEDVIVDTQKEILNLSIVNGPELQNGDQIEFYYVPEGYAEHIVLKLNGEDVRDIYELELIEPKDSSVVQKRILISYICFFLLCNGIAFYLSRKGYKKRKQQFNRFMRANNAEEKATYVWGMGVILYVILLIFALLGIVNPVVMSILLSITFFVLHVACMIAVAFRDFCMIYNYQSIQVGTVVGYYQSYALEEIIRVMKETEHIYMVKLPDKQIRVQVNDERQRAVIIKLGERNDGSGV